MRRLGEIGQNGRFRAKIAIWGGICAFSAQTGFFFFGKKKKKTENVTIKMSL